MAKVCIIADDMPFAGRVVIVGQVVNLRRVGNPPARGEASPQAFRLHFSHFKNIVIPTDPNGVFPFAAMSSGRKAN
jgi:hypothetical protein